MSSIPPEMHDKILGLAVEITNATLAEDDALSQSLYQRLLEYYRAQMAVGHGHPFLTETIADFTDDAFEALSYYQTALEQTGRIGKDEPTQTILLGIATQLLALGKHEQAEAYLRDGQTEAIRRGDEFSIAEAERLSKEIPD